MHLHTLQIRNFRSIAKLDLELKPGANLLVGPNASGKTTVLEAIRMNKALLAPRTPSETRQVLLSLGVLTNASPNQLNFAAIAGDEGQAVEVNCTYKLTENEVATLPEVTVSLAQQMIAGQMGIDPNQGQLGLIQFFSSPAGRRALADTLANLQRQLAEFALNRICRLHLTANKQAGFVGADLGAQALFSVLEKRLPPSRTPFSYFPADRALAVGDVQIQLGSADAAQQLESHNSQPALKYQRLKNVIFSTIISSSKDAEEQKENFQKIFKTLLKGKSLEVGGTGVNQFGQATIMIQDEGSDKAYDIDSLSSGEKGLILTFLLISRSLQPGGLILLDEPELHLNSAVCKDLLDFLLDEYLNKDSIQAIICTHSPEIMSAALRRDECDVYNIRRNAAASLIRKNDHAEAAQALKLLGTSEVEALLFDAVVFVEGPDDVDLLEYAFRDFLSRIKFRELSGRGEVEKYIQLLIAADEAGKSENLSYFIFDHDRRPTKLTSTENVKIKQWGRYCLENYLIEPEILYDTVRQDLRPKNWPSTLGEARELFASMAKEQLRSRIIDDVYRSLSLQDTRLRSDDKKQTFADSAERIYGKFETLRDQMSADEKDAWIAHFAAECEKRMALEQDEWNTKWVERCSGKIFLQDVYSYANPKADMAMLKRSLLTAHRLKDSESWKLLRITLQDLTHKKQ